MTAPTPTESLVFNAQADVLDDLSHWCERFDEPSGELGWVSSAQLADRARELRKAAQRAREGRLEVLLDDDRPEVPPVSRAQWLTVGEAAALMGVHVATLRRWAREGRVPFTRMPNNRGDRRFDRDTLRKWMASRERSAR